MTRRTGLLLALIALVLVAALLHGPIAQDPAYHRFADARSLWGVPNLWNVLSNLPFLVVGALGLYRLAHGPIAGLPDALRPACAVFYMAAGLIAFGSAWYHLAPDDARLVWDRLPMTLAFMAYFATIVGQHVDAQLGRRMLAPLLVAGAASVAWWWWSGDLRAYAVVQFLPLLLIPCIVLGYPSRHADAGRVWAVLGLYALSKALEWLDVPLYDALGLSGHTLKHVAAAAAVHAAFSPGRAAPRPAAPAS